MQTRRTFLKKMMLGGGLFSLGQFPFQSFAATNAIHFTILHTNDTHSRLEPFPYEDKKYGGQGGVVRRARLIKDIRKEVNNVLLFDAGDVFQGTPYFNLYHGEPEIKAMSMMGYDAMTMGSHDFDGGIEGFAAQLPHANFPVLVANYDFGKTGLAGKIQPHKVFEFQGIRIGVYGLGIQLYGLVAPEAYGRTYHQDPIQKAKETEEFLKKKQNCDMVICLSHLGYEYGGLKVSDKLIAAATNYTDLILGGHTHTFLETPTVLKNQLGKDVIINQVGWAGLRLGRLDFIYNANKKISMTKANTVIITKQTTQ